MSIGRKNSVAVIAEMLGGLSLEELVEYKVHKARLSAETCQDYDSKKGADEIWLSETVFLRAVSSKSQAGNQASAKDGTNDSAPSPTSGATPGQKNG